MGRLTPEIPFAQHYRILALDLKNRVPLIHRVKSLSDSDLEKITDFIKNPFGSSDSSAAREYQAQVEALQGKPVFSEIQEAARKCLARGHDDLLCLFQAFFLTLHHPSLPHLESLKKKYDGFSFIMTDEIKEMFADWENEILTDELAKTIFFNCLINSVSDTSPDWDERREVIRFLKKQAASRERFLIGDFGCGVGKWTKKFREQLDDPIIFFASDQHYHEAVSYYVWSPEKGLDFFQADFRNIPFSDSCLDCGLLIYVMPQIAGWAAAVGLRAINRALKEGGFLIVGPSKRKGEILGSGWAVLRKRKGLLVESEEEFF